MSQIAADRANGSHRIVTTEGNADDRHSRSTGATMGFGSRQSTQESPIKRLNNDMNNQKTIRSISALNPQRSSPITHREDTCGTIHSPNFAQNIEMMTQKFDSFRATNPDEQWSSKGSSQNLRMSFDQRSMQGPQLSSSRVQSQGVNSCSNNNKKKVFDPAAAAAQPTRLSAQSLMGLTKSKLTPLLSSSRLHLHSNQNKENQFRGNNTTGSAQDDQYSSVTSVSMRETDLEKANERIRYLDTNLRREMLNSEEQRTSMAILKQELERKLHEFGFMNFFKTNNSAQNLSHIDIYMELQVIKKKLLEKEEKLALFAREKEPLLRELDELKSRNTYLEGSYEAVRSQLGSMKADEEEIEDLRAEKINLIEFVEKIKSENERLEEEYIALKNESNANKRSGNQQNSIEERRRTQIEGELREQIEYLSCELAAKNQDIESLADSLKQLNADNESMESQKRQLQASNDEIQAQLTSISLKHASLESELSDTQTYRSNLKSENSGLRNDLENYMAEVENLRKTLKAQSDKFSQLEMQNEGLTETIKMQSEQILGWKHSSQTSTFLQNQFESYQQKFDDAKDNIFTLTQTLEETNAELQKVQAKCQNFELISKEKAHIILEKDAQIAMLSESIKNREKEGEELKRRIQEDSKEKYMSQFNSERRSINLQMDHLKSSNSLLERKLQDVEMMNEQLRIELDERHGGGMDEIGLSENAKLKYEQSVAFYEKKIKELKLQSMGRRQEQISLSVQIGLAADITKQLQSYIRGCEDFELVQLVEDLDFQIEEIVGLTQPTHSSGNGVPGGHNSIGGVNQVSSNTTHRNMNSVGSYQYSSRNNVSTSVAGVVGGGVGHYSQQSSHMTPQNPAINFTPQHSQGQMPARSKEIEDLKNILQIKDREIQALKNENQDHTYGMSQQQSVQQVSRYERAHSRNSEQQQHYMHHGMQHHQMQSATAAQSGTVNGGYYSGRQNLKSYFN